MPPFDVSAAAVSSHYAQNDGDCPPFLRSRVGDDSIEPMRQRRVVDRYSFVLSEDVRSLGRRTMKLGLPTRGASFDSSQARFQSSCFSKTTPSWLAEA